MSASCQDFELGSSNSYDAKKEQDLFRTYGVPVSLTYWDKLWL